MEDGSSGPMGALSEGTPCLRHHCVACCLETEMPLTKDDLKRIESLGFRSADFTIESNEETRLRNLNKVCFFLRESRCIIYEKRPEGCRIYPLVYDIDTHKYVYDSVCAHSNEFKATREDKDKLKRLISKLDKESLKKRK